MRDEPDRSLTLVGEAATTAFGAALADALPDPAQGPLVIHLQGELGAGKTTLVRGLLRRLGVAGSIRSPTYTLVDSYEAAGRTFVHVDLYRVRSAEEVDELALPEYLLPRHVMLIEWPQQGGAAVPPADLLLQLDHREAGRQVSLVSRSPAGEILVRTAVTGMVK